MGPCTICATQPVMAHYVTAHPTNLQASCGGVCRADLAQNNTDATATSCRIISITEVFYSFFDSF